MTESIRPGQGFALRHARHVTADSEILLWDHGCASDAQAKGTSYDSPFQLVTAPGMHLLVEDGLLLGSDYEGPSPVPIPPSVRHLSATLYDTGPNPTGDTKLAHNCTTV